MHSRILELYRKPILEAIYERFKDCNNNTYGDFANLGNCLSAYWRIHAPVQHSFWLTLSLLCIGFCYCSTSHQKGKERIYDFGLRSIFSSYPMDFLGL